MKKRVLPVLLLSLALILSSCAFPSPSIHLPDASRITPEELVRKLSAPEFGGRLAGTDENRKAAQYIAEAFEALGLEKYIETGWLQEYTHTFPQRIKEMYDINEDSAQIHNVVGKIPGTDSKKALVLSAHFDHLGIREGILYPGAVDNCSGLSLLLDVAGKLKEKFTNSRPEYDIIICAFNGEEHGLQGSKAFVADAAARYSLLNNINLECIEGKESKKLILIGDPDLGQKLQQDMKLHLVSKGFECEIAGNKYGSDHLSFSRSGFISFTLGQEATNTLHTPNDTADTIDYDFLEKSGAALFTFITYNKARVYPTLKTGEEP